MKAESRYKNAHWRGNPGNVREFDSYSGNIRNLTTEKWWKCLVRESCFIVLHLVLCQCLFAQFMNTCYSIRYDVVTAPWLEVLCRET